MARALLAVLGVTLAVGPVAGQETDVLTRDIRAVHDRLREDIIRSAERMPAEDFDFRPAPRLQTFGQVVEQVTTDLYVFCAAAGAASTPRPSTDGETATDKTELMEALRAAYDYCDETLASLDDENGRVRVAEPRVATRLSFLVSAVERASVQYGVMATYLRIKGLTPASPDRLGAEDAGSVADPQPPEGFAPVLIELQYRFPTQDGRSRRFRRTYVRQADGWGHVSVPSRDQWVSYAEAEPVLLADAERFWRSGQFESLWVDVTDRPFENGVVGRIVVFNLVEQTGGEVPDAAFPTTPAGYVEPPPGARRLYPPPDTGARD